METVSAKFDEDTIEEIERYREKNDIGTKSEAYRQLVRKGLRVEDERRKVILDIIYIFTGFTLFGLFNSASGWKVIKLELLGGVTTAFLMISVLLIGVYIFGWYKI
jgi:hypothetical protein